MKGIILDENIPKRITFSTSLPVFHSADLGPSATDTAIWLFARQKELIILTKDTDFSNRIMLSSPPPWVVHIRFGNLRKTDFHSLLRTLWPHVEALLPDHKLINVFSHRIEGIQG